MSRENDGPLTHAEYGRRGGINAAIRVLTVVAFPLLILPSHALADECLKYEPEMVTLTGTISRKTFPGFPNYSSIKEGDHADKVMVLRLDRPICVIAEPSGKFNESEEDVLNIQLVVERQTIPNWPKPNEHVESAKVVVRGNLYHQNWGFEHTKVLMRVKNMRLAEHKDWKPQ